MILYFLSREMFLLLLVEFFFLFVYLAVILVALSSHSSCNPPHMCGHVESPFMEKVSRDNSCYVVVAFYLELQQITVFFFSFSILTWVEMMLEFLSCALVALYLIFVVFHFIFTIFYIYGVFLLSVTKHNEMGSKSLLHQQGHP